MKLPTRRKINEITYKKLKVHLWHSFISYFETSFYTSPIFMLFRDIFNGHFVDSSACKTSEVHVERNRALQQGEDEIFNFHACDFFTKLVFYSVLTNRRIEKSLEDVDALDARISLVLHIPRVWRVPWHSNVFWRFQPLRRCFLP